jgi:hypothetical protein
MTISGAGDVPTGVDFNPRVDRIRVVNSNDANFRINPNNGALAAIDAGLTYTAPATGPITGAAYDRNVAPGPPGTPPGTTQTTLYGIDAGSDRLVVQGGIDGTAPGGPNGGQIKSIGPLTVTVPNSSAGFDIAPDGTAYAVLLTGLAPSLYTVNLSTGTATLIGQLGASIHDITILAVDNCPTVSGDNQADLDGDGAGDACDPDIDGDGLTNDAEAARGTDPRNPDTDADGVGDASDACPTLAGTAAKNGCDGTAPTITITRTPRRMKRKRFFHGVVARISAGGEVARLDVALLGRARSARVARTGDIVLAERHLGLSTRTRSLRLRPKRALVSRSRRFRVRLRVTATDAAGNSATKTRTIRVRR